jgi:hypothetical protein
MAMNITKVEGTCQIKAWTTDTADMTDSGPATVFLARFFDTLTNGTGSDKANQVYMDSATLNASTRTTYDLAASLTDVYGTTITFTRIKGIFLANTSTTAAVLAIGGGSDGAGTNAFVNWISAAAEEVNVRAGGCFMLWAPDATAYAVTAGTGDILGITETAALASTFELGIIGEV